MPLGWPQALTPTPQALTPTPKGPYNKGLHAGGGGGSYVLDLDHLGQALEKDGRARRVSLSFLFSLSSSCARQRL